MPVTHRAALHSVRFCESLLVRGGGAASCGASWMTASAEYTIAESTSVGSSNCGDSDLMGDDDSGCAEAVTVIGSAGSQSTATSKRTSKTPCRITSPQSSRCTCGDRTMGQNARAISHAIATNAVARRTTGMRSLRRLLMTDPPRGVPPLAQSACGSRRCRLR